MKVLEIVKDELSSLTSKSKGILSIDEVIFRLSLFRLNSKAHSALADSTKHFGTKLRH